MSLHKRDILSVKDLTKEEIVKILELAKWYAAKGRTDHFKGKVAALCFFEPSTRTFVSFDLAMKYLGGSTTGFQSAGATSIAKGESLQDTIKTIDSYGVDVIIMRHPQIGSAKTAADIAKSPVVNAGDGSNEHPTQSLVDLYTIQERKGDLNNLHIGVLGDLKNARTVHSLILALSHFSPRFSFISPKELAIDDSYKEELKRKSIDFREVENVNEVIGSLDVLYVTRLQKERFETLEEYEKLKGSYNIGRSILEGAKKDLIILHPLPRIDELSTELDAVENAAYFQQTKDSIAVRQALLALIFGVPS